jgi:2-C-methyl-D-erythritol 4-phosphate cytidylyltransferase
MKKYAIIVAGGLGSRMNSALPKQFLCIDNKPILFHTIQRFLDYSEKIEIILVLPKEQLSEWDKLCDQFSFYPSIEVTTGGASRFQSVKNGLALINEEGLVAIQDGVRPFATRAILDRTYQLAKEKGNGIAAISLKDSIRSVSGNATQSEDRTKFRLIQTPQTFQVSLIKKAYLTTEDTLFTDDASVLERAGEKIFLAEGSSQNIKITTPDDLIIAEALIKNFIY